MLYEITVRLVNPTEAELAKVNELAGYSAGTGGGGGDPLPLPAGDSFPVDPYDAPFPSPPGQGIPNKLYQRDKTGSIFTMPLVEPTYYPTTVSGTAFAGYIVYVDGIAQNVNPDGLVDDGLAVIYFTRVVTDIEGFVWAQVCNGQWNKYTGSRFEFTGGPPVVVDAPPVVKVMPPDPPRAAIAPGSSGRVVKVGPTELIHTISAYMLDAIDGDTCELAGVTFTESVVIGKTVKFKGVPGLTKISGKDVAYKMGGRGCIIPTVDTIWEDIDFIETGMDDTSSQLTSCVRPGGQQWLEFIRCGFYDSQCGVGTDSGGTPNQVLILTDCKAARCGLPDERSHNFYIGNGTVRVEIKNLETTAPNAAHAFKSRAHGLTWDGGIAEGHDNASAIDLPDGTASQFKILGVTINKAAGAANHLMFSYAEESQKNGTAGGTITGTINALCEQPKTQVGAGTVDTTGATWTGNRPVTNDGAGTVLGLPT